MIQKKAKQPKTISFLKKTAWPMAIFVFISLYLGYKIFLKPPLSREDIIPILVSMKGGEYKETQSIKIKLETDNAFIPYENIRAHFEITVVDPTLNKNYLSDTTPFIAPLGSKFSNNKLNEINKVNTKGVIPNYNSFLKLYKTNLPNVYEGNAEIFYPESGKFPVVITYSKTDFRNIMNITIDGSTADNMNKNTNSILIIIGLFTLGLTGYLGFKKK